MNDMLQIRRSHRVLFLDMCGMFCRRRVSLSIIPTLGNIMEVLKLMKVLRIYWVAPPLMEVFVSCHILREGIIQEASPLQRGVVFAGLWRIWLGRNCIIFNEWATSSNELWETSTCLATVWVKAHDFYSIASIFELHHN